LDKFSNLKFDSGVVTGALVTFIRDELSRTGFGRLILGLSGGVDSAVVAYLSVRALGNDNVIGVIMPYKTSNPKNMKDAEEIIKEIGIRRYLIDITSQVDHYFERFPDADDIRRGNKMARERMSVLYDLSAAEQALVIGTSNKTEILLGYGTIHGDLACAINPIGGIYKTHVRKLARSLGVPEKIVTKAPSADLYAGQSDEGEFGFTYEEVDRLLFLLAEKGYTSDECKRAGYSPEMVKTVTEMMESNRFKGSPPVMADVSGILYRSDSSGPGEQNK
jgi:NAD+ synthase